VKSTGNKRKNEEDVKWKQWVAEVEQKMVDQGIIEDIEIFYRTKDGRSRDN
jgi:hypothetical protein